MRNFYTLFFLLYFAITGYTQQTHEIFYVDKAWVNEYEEWSTFKYTGQIIFSPLTDDGNVRIVNYDFLYDLSGGKAKFANKATYTNAEFKNSRKVSAQTDKQGVISTTYEGVLVFESGNDYYSVDTVVTILKKNSYVGFKMHLKNSTREYAFSFKPNS